MIKFISGETAFKKLCSGEEVFITHDLYNNKRSSCISVEEFRTGIDRKGRELFFAIQTEGEEAIVEDGLGFTISTVTARKVEQLALDFLKEKTNGEDIIFVVDKGENLENSFEGKRIKDIHISFLTLIHHRYLNKESSLLFHLKRK